VQLNTSYDLERYPIHDMSSNIDYRTFQIGELEAGVLTYFAWSKDHKSVYAVDADELETTWFSNPLYATDEYLQTFNSPTKDGSRYLIADGENILEVLRDEAGSFSVEPLVTFTGFLSYVHFYDVLGDDKEEIIFRNNYEFFVSRYEDGKYQDPEVVLSGPNRIYESFFDIDNDGKAEFLLYRGATTSAFDISNELTLESYDLDPDTGLNYIFPIHTQEYNEAFAFHIYSFPNPSYGRIQFTDEVTVLYVTDQSGKPMNVDKSDRTNLLTSCPTGIYYVTVEIDGKIFTAKHVKQ